MPRRPRLRLADVPFHVIQRGNNRSACFYSDTDRVRYLTYLQAQVRKYGVAVHAYVLMTNHVHLLMTPRQPEGIGLVMKFLGQLYVQYMNRTHDRTGSLWEGRFRSCLVDSEAYLLHCHRYIETNPVRAGMVKHPSDYPWSSYWANALGVPNPLLTLHPVVNALGRTPAEVQATYRELLSEELESGLVQEIRSATNGGFALGSGQFIDKVAGATGRPAARGKRGPKLKVP